MEDSEQKGLQGNINLDVKSPKERHKVDKFNNNKKIRYGKQSKHATRKWMHLKVPKMDNITISLANTRISKVISKSSRIHRKWKQNNKSRKIERGLEKTASDTIQLLSR